MMCMLRPKKHIGSDISSDYCRIIRQLYQLQTTLKYTFKGKVWKHSGQSGWYFITVPKDISAEIRTHSKWQEEGWGRLNIQATIHQTHWQSAIWFDTKHDSYLLPIKAEIRRKYDIKEGDDVVMTMVL